MANRGLSPLALEFLHKTGQRFYSGKFNCIVKRDAHAAHRTMARSADKSGSFRLLREILFNGFLTACNAEDHVHQRPRTLFHRALEVAIAAVNRVIEQFCLCFVALLHRVDSTERIDPLHYETNDINRESWRRVVERLL